MNEFLSAKPTESDRNASKALIQLCKPEVTGSIPVRSIVSNRADSGEKSPQIARIDHSAVLGSSRRFGTRFQPLLPGAAQGLGQTAGAVQGLKSGRPGGGDT